MSITRFPPAISRPSYRSPMSTCARGLGQGRHEQRIVYRAGRSRKQRPQSGSGNSEAARKTVDRKGHGGQQGGEGGRGARTLHLAHGIRGGDFVIVTRGASIRPALARFRLAPGGFLAAGEALSLRQIPALEPQRAGKRGVGHGYGCRERHRA